MRCCKKASATTTRHAVAKCRVRGRVRDRQHDDRCYWGCDYYHDVLVGRISVLVFVLCGAGGVLHRMT